MSDRIDNDYDNENDNNNRNNQDVIDTDNDLDTTNSDNSDNPNRSTHSRMGEAIERDWDQTKKDLHLGGRDLNQNVDDTVRQGVGKEAVPSRNTPNYDNDRSIDRDLDDADTDLADTDDLRPTSTI